MKSEYAAAFERQLDWLRWSASEDAKQMWERAEKAGIKAVDRYGHSDPRGNKVARSLYNTPLLYGDVYYVSGKVQDWLLRGRERGLLPLAKFEQQWLPSPYGFVSMAKDIWLAAGTDILPSTAVRLDGPGMTPQDVDIEADPDTIAAQAFGWSPSTAGVNVVFYGKHFTITLDQEKVNAMLKGENEQRLRRAAERDEQVRMRLRTTDIASVEEGRGYYPIAWFDIRVGAHWQEEAEEYRRISGLALNPRSVHGARAENADIEIAFAYAFFMFVNGRHIVARRHRADRPARKRAEAVKPKPTEDVTVIMLRAEEEAEFDGRDPNSVPIPRDYVCRWMVREHMRTNPRTGERTIRVREYTKGPEGLPMKSGQRIYAVVR